MNLKLLILAISFFYTLSLVHTQNPAYIIPQGSDIKFDGIIGSDEWLDAVEMTFPNQNNIGAKVFMKHHNDNLLIAYTFSERTDSIYVFPEIFIDTQLDKSSNWEEDDFWFHVSAQDCYSVGKREDYSKCRTDDQIWKAIPNYPFGDEFVILNEFEISIPFDLLKIEPAGNIGICLSIAIYPGDIRINYPEGSHEDIPETWTEFEIK